MHTIKRARAKNVAKKRITGVKVPRTDTRQQFYLKTRFQATRPCQKQSSVPPSQRIWRRTVVQTKPKVRTRIPKLFRMDRHTGLPVDYERTVNQVMHYVNPHLHNPPSAELVLEQLLAKMLAEVVRQGGHCCQDTTQLWSLLKNRSHCRSSSHFLTKAEKDKREANESLSQFHSACKRRPSPTHSPKLGPTYMSKFNFNQLRIKSS
ncbi:uncharacterized protein LOC6542414 [Drosophila erecta]|uniref:Uncharacterized protein n=1 Tax=Drosophila erecta TaxID=7220 RepID=B3N3Q1_DROER|nr:uncharacterized protein LOC6542414 [Drosophila erecta]EDV57710.1 uncharacterized protein Dere_GG24989 [Drosophila erecta]